MRCFTSYVCVLSALVAVGLAAPAPLFPNSFGGSASLQLGGSSPSSGTSTATSNNSITDILSGIDIPGLLKSVNSVVKLVGVFCPPLSQVLDNVIQNVTSTAFRVFGRLILRGGLGGGGGGTSSGGGQKVNVVLPTFPPDEDDYDDEDESTPAPGSDDNVDLRKSSSSTNTVTSPTTISSSTDSPQTTVTAPSNDDNAIAKRHVRVVREAEDQDGAESAPQPAEDLSNVEEDDADRNKRYSPFGGDGQGGSGNFLFDIIRNTADRAARTVGTVYRMVAGTQSLGWGLQTTPETSYGASFLPTPFKLVAGSGATEESDEKAHAPGGVAEVDISSAKGHGDGYTEGIPGPITRLFVIANRGIANLVQDLILRLAQTSERLVNFKARLVTSLI